MGGLCSGCCGGETSESSKKPNGKTGADGSGQQLFKGDDSDQQKEQQLIGDDKLKDETAKTFRAEPGDGGYAKARAKSSLGKPSHGDEHPKGLIGQNTAEYQAVRQYLSGRGYTVEASIGSGNYAEVYRAVNRTGKTVAIKVIVLKKAAANYRLKMLPAEIRVLARCKHPNIIKMYEICQSSNRIYMVMEFAANGTAADWLKDRGALTEPLAHIQFTQILAAIHHMHSQHIAHRDLKLENILITRHLNPKISDFSYAVVVDSQTSKSTQFCGSLPYFSPEILQRLPHDPTISDIWSLGVCFYIMLNDGLPFPLGNDKLMLVKQLHKDWHFRPKVDSKLSQPLKSVIGRMLEPDVTRRATSQSLTNDVWFKRSPTGPTPASS